MRKMAILSVMLLPLWVKGAEPLISMTFNDAPVSEVLQALADYQQVNLLVAPEVEGTLTLTLRDVAWNQAWQLVTRMAKVESEKQQNVLLVFPRSWREEREQQAQIEKEKALQTQPLENRTLVLKYADANAVFTSLQQEKGALMTARASITVDNRTNSLLLRDTPKALDETCRWLAALDVPLQQVELVAHIVTIGQDSLRELGVRWGVRGEEQVTQALRASQFRVNLGVADPAMNVGFTVARLDGRLLDLELSALEQQDQVEIIASPHLFTSHQQPASIRQGTEIPYEVSSGGNGKTAMEFREAMLGMNVTPVIQANGRILLKLHITQNVPGRMMRTGEREVVTIDKQEIETQVTVNNGQTLALGGIFQQQRNQGKRQVPVLGDIPIIGGLFRHDVQQQKRRELVIFITPRLTAA